MIDGETNTERQTKGETNAEKGGVVQIKGYTGRQVQVDEDRMLCTSILVQKERREKFFAIEKLVARDEAVFERHCHGLETKLK